MLEQYRLRVSDPDNIFAPYISSYDNLLAAGRFNKSSHRRYIAAVIHLGDWFAAQGQPVGSLDGAVISRFLTEHLPNCGCKQPVPRALLDNRSALNHLFRLLVSEGAVTPAVDEIARELRSFDQRTAEVWGLSQGTRDHRRRIIRRFLAAMFGSEPIDILSMKPAAIRSFVLGDATWSASTIRVVAGAVRCYLRYRQLLGDNVKHLVSAIPQPSPWGRKELPQALSGEELNELYRSFELPCQSKRRGYAIVRCLADLGLRSSEVINLDLDDIDWEAGTLRVMLGKARRSNLMPLTPTVGAAIADYILHERPQTTCRKIFVRHVAPLGEPIGRRVVQQVLHAAYRRLGWSRTRVHILRHTLATRLINAGAPMKEVADVLRHRSIVTSAAYARVDTARLSAVALPWPGSAA